MKKRRLTQAQKKKLISLVVMVVVMGAGPRKLESDLPK